MRVSRLALLGLCIPLSGCGVANVLAERAAIAKADFSFERLEVLRLESPLSSRDPQVEFRLTLGVSNPNPISATLDRLDFQVSLQGVAIASGTSAQLFSVPAGERRSLPLTFSVPYLSLPQPVLRALDARQATLGFTGTSHLATPLGVLMQPVEFTRTTAF